MLVRTLGNDLRDIPEVARHVREHLEKAGVAGSTVYAIDLALEELLVNTIRHGYSHECAERCEIRLRVLVKDEEVRVLIQDDRGAFDPTSATLPDIPGSIQEARIGGLGLRMVRSMIRDIRYRRTLNGNELELVLPRSAS